MKEIKTEGEVAAYAYTNVHVCANVRMCVLVFMLAHVKCMSALVSRCFVRYSPRVHLTQMLLLFIHLSM